MYLAVFGYAVPIAICLFLVQTIVITPMLGNASRVIAV
jgi:hypothetical protein